MAKLLVVKDRNLLLNSEEPKQYPWLVDLLDKNETLSEELAASLPPDQARFLRQELSRLITQAGKEWRPTDFGNWKEDLLTPKIRCALCGALCRYVCYISNDLNGIRLNVGRECVLDFMDEYKGMTPYHIKKLAVRNRLLADLNSHFTEMDWDTVIHEWGTSLEQRRVLAPIDVENQYAHLGREARRILDDYLDGQVAPDVAFGQFATFARTRLELLAAIDAYVDAHATDRFIVTRKMAVWLAGKDPVATQQLCQDGYVTRDTVSRVFEPDFMVSLVPELDRLMGALRLRVPRALPQQHAYLVHPTTESGLQLVSPHVRLLSTALGRWLFEPATSDLLPAQVCRLRATIVGFSKLAPQSTDRMLLLLRAPLLKHQLRLWNYDNAFNEIYIFDLNYNAYIVAPLDTFVSDYTGVAFDLSSPTVENAASFLRSMKHPRYDRSDFGGHDRYHFVRRRF